jgi:RNA polymerase sigma-70 factor (ECF subfamily)
VATYLTRIAINLSLNELKRRKRRRLLDLQTVAAAELPTVTAEPAEWREVLEKSMERLDAGFRAVVVLRLIEGYSTRETAEILSVPEGTVLSRLSRAQKQLQWLSALTEPAAEFAKPLAGNVRDLNRERQFDSRGFDEKETKKSVAL